MADELDDGLDYSFDNGSDATGLIDIPDDVSLHDTDSESERRAKPQQSAESSSKKRKRKEKKDDDGPSKSKRQLRMTQDMEKKQTIAQMDAAIVADFILSHVRRKRANKDVSALELEDQSVPQSAIVDSADFELARSLESLEKYLKEFKLASPQNNDLVLILSMSAPRVCDVARAVKPVSKHGSLKLINKNKLDYDKKGLASAAFLAVATPGRIQKLMALDVLDPKRVKHIVMDSSFLDSKNNAVWDLEETVPLVAQLTRQGAKLFLF